MESSFEKDAKVFKALCDPRRLEILKQLRSGEKCACVLQDQMDIGQSGLSYHMEISGYLPEGPLCRGSSRNAY